MADVPLPKSLLNDRLPDWWRPLSVSITGEIVRMREEGIVELVTYIERSNLADYVAYAYGDITCGFSVIGDIRKSARTADAAFAGDPADAEPRAIACAALVELMVASKDQGLAAAAAHMVLSAEFGGHSVGVPGMTLGDYAQRYLTFNAVATRRLPRVGLGKSATQLAKETLAGAEEIGDTGTAIADSAVLQALNVYGEALSTVANRLDLVTRRAQAGQDLLDEQLSLQTWLLETWCVSAAMPWGEVSPDARPVLAGLELAQRTHGVIPAENATALLSTVLQVAANGQVPMTTALSAVAAAGPFLGNRLNAAPSSISFPFAKAAELWTASGGSAGWRPKRLLPTNRRDGVVLAVQVYREALALRALEHE